MERSSRIALITAAILLAACGALYARATDTDEGPLTHEVADRLVAEGAHALERKDTDAILSLVAPGGRLVGRSLDQMRFILDQTFREEGRRTLKVHARNIESHQMGRSGVISLDMDLDEDAPHAKIHYYTTHLDIALRKVRATHMLGLYHSDDWKIADVQADSALNVPTP